MILVAGHFRVPPENLASLRPLMRTVIAETRREAGCVVYSYAEDVAEPGLVRVFEQWTGRAELDAHLASPHMARWVAERAQLGLHDRTIRSWTVDEGEQI